MASANQVHASPGTAIINGKAYTIRPLTDTDYAELEAYVQDQHIAITRRNIEGLPAEQQQKLLEQAFDRAAQMQISSPQALKLMMTPQGAIRMLWMAMRKDHPMLSLADVAELVQKPDALKAAADMLADVERRAMPKIPKRRAATRRRRR